MTDDLLEYSAHFVFGGVISFMSWFFGGSDGFLMVLLTFMVIDQFSGLAAGWAEHKISSEAGFKGILKKCLILAFVGMAHLMDEYLFAHTVFGEVETASYQSRDCSVDAPVAGERSSQEHLRARVLQHQHFNPHSQGAGFGRRNRSEMDDFPSG